MKETPNMKLMPISIPVPVTNPSMQTSLRSVKLAGPKQLSKPPSFDQLIPNEEPDNDKQAG